MLAEMERWRSFFALAEADLWTIIDQAILLAAADFPTEFKHKRCEIAEILFARRPCLSPPTRSMDATMLSGSVITNAIGDGDTRPPHPTRWGDDNGMRHSYVSRVEVKAADTQSHDTVCKPSVVERHLLHDHKTVEVDTYLRSYKDTKDVTEASHSHAIAHPVLQDVIVIKAWIMDLANQSEDGLLQSLHSLEHLDITVEILKATDIGREVNKFRKHSSVLVRNLVKQLVRTWKGMVDEWVKNADIVPPLIDSGVLSVVAASGEQEIAVREGLAVRNVNSQIEGLAQRSLQPSKQSLNKSIVDSTSLGKVHLHSEHPVEEMGSSRVESDELYRPGFIEKKANLCGEQAQFSRCVVVKYNNGGLGPGRPVNTMLEGERDFVNDAIEHHKKAEDSSRSCVQKLAAVGNKRFEAMKRRLPSEDQQTEHAKKEREMVPSSSLELSKRGFLNARLPASAKTQHCSQRR